MESNIIEEIPEIVNPDNPDNVEQPGLPQDVLPEIIEDSLDSSAGEPVNDEPVNDEPVSDEASLENGDSTGSEELTGSPEADSTENTENPEGELPSDSPVAGYDPSVSEDILKALNGMDTDLKEYQKLYKEVIVKQDVAIHNMQVISTTTNLGIFMIIGILLAIILAFFYSNHR